MKAIWKIAFVFLLTVGGIFVVSQSTFAAAKPYEYTFTKDANNTRFNGISSINQLEITFDKTISVVKDRDGDNDKDQDDLFIDQAIDNPVYIENENGTKKINIIKDVTVSGKKLIVTFKNLDFIDYTDQEKLEYELVIDKETLRFDQLEEYIIPFKIYDILPGFKSTFLDTDAPTINTNIFKINAPRDVFVHVPKIYIRGIETIHHYDGILPDPIPGNQGDIIKDPINPKKPKNPQLTNIDILAEEEARRLQVEFGGDSIYSRDLARHSAVAGFTMGQAGIREITNNQSESTNEFSLRAYDVNGRFLEQRKFKLRVKDPKKDYIIDDYLPEPTEEFGKIYSLYDLMADPELLNAIIERIPVSQLDSLGVTYTYAVGSDGNSNSSIAVESLEELKMALANDKITKIKLNKNIFLTTPLLIDRSVTIEGSYELQGDVKLGTGQDIEIRLEGITITGDLGIDVGVNGTAILDNVEVKGTTTDPATTIISGGSNSIHLNEFQSNGGIKFSNRAPVRVVTAQPIETLVIDGSGDVILEGTYTTVYINSNAKLITRKNTSIDKLIVGEGVDLDLIDRYGSVIEIIYKDTINKIEGIMQNTDASSITTQDLKDAGVTHADVLDANITDYQEAISKAADGDLDTEVEIQAMVTTVNAIVKIEGVPQNGDASNITVQDLKDAGVPTSVVLEANITAYQDFISKAAPGDLDSTGKILAMVTKVNAIVKIEGVTQGGNASRITTQDLKDAGVIAADVLDANITAYRNAIKDAADGDLDTEVKIQAMVTKVNAIEKIEGIVQGGDASGIIRQDLINVGVPAAKFFDANITAYQDAIKDAADGDLGTEDEIQAMVTKVNAIVKIEGVVQDGDASNITIQDLKDAGVPAGNVLDANLTVYQKAIKKAADSDLDSTVKIRAMVIKVNAIEKIEGVAQGGDASIITTQDLKDAGVPISDALVSNIIAYQNAIKAADVGALDTEDKIREMVIKENAIAKIEKVAQGGDASIITTQDLTDAGVQASDVANIYITAYQNAIKEAADGELDSTEKIKVMVTTVNAAIEKIEGVAQGGDASGITTIDLKNAGVTASDVMTSNIADYRAAISAAADSDLDKVDEIQKMVTIVNAVVTINANPVDEGVTVDLFTQAGITGVESGNLDESKANIKVAKTTKGSALTKNEIQTVVDNTRAVMAEVEKYETHAEIANNVTAGSDIDSTVKKLRHAQTASPLATIENRVADNTTLEVSSDGSKFILKKVAINGFGDKEVIAKFDISVGTSYTAVSKTVTVSVTVVEQLD